ncbi:MAG: hypothetical protein ABH827_01345 [bacterium]
MQTKKLILSAICFSFLASLLGNVQAMQKSFGLLTKQLGNTSPYISGCNFNTSHPNSYNPSCWPNFNKENQEIICDSDIEKFKNILPQIKDRDKEIKETLINLKLETLPINDTDKKLILAAKKGLDKEAKTILKENKDLLTHNSLIMALLGATKNNQVNTAKVLIDWVIKQSKKQEDKKIYTNGSFRIMLLIVVFCVSFLGLQFERPDYSSFF